MIKHHRSDVIGKFILHHMDNGHSKCAFPDLSTRRDRMRIKYLVDEAVKPVRGGGRIWKRHWDSGSSKRLRMTCHSVRCRRSPQSRRESGLSASKSRVTVVTMGVSSTSWWSRHGYSCV